MKALLRRLFGRFYWVKHSKSLNYKGAWKNGVFNGPGQLKYANGTTFRGTFSNGLKHGSGVLLSSSGYRYAGDWVKGKKTGFAMISYKNGSYFRGNVLDGLRHGHGEIFDALSKIRFKGVWVKDIIKEEVTITSSQWLFVGPMPDYEGNTKGEMKYPNGSVYQGELKDFMRHGQGILKTDLSETIEGIWSDNVNVQKAEKWDASGAFWKGNLRNLKPQGYMHVKLPNGQHYDGLWENGSMLRVLSVKNQSKAVSPYHMH